MTLIVFLIEDNPLISENMISALSEIAGARVIRVADEEDDAVAWVRANHQWQVAVVDLFLKAGSGLGVLAALQARGPHQAAVVLSNYATPAVRAQCAALGADRTFDKSTELEAFFAYCAERSGLR